MFILELLNAIYIFLNRRSTATNINDEVLGSYWFINIGKIPLSLFYSLKVSLLLNAKHLPLLVFWSFIVKDDKRIIS